MRSSQAGPSARCCPWARALFAGVVVWSSVLAGGATREDPQNFRERAHNAEEKKNYVEAERLYRRRLTIAPNDLQTLKQLGLLYQKELKFEESLPLFQRVLKADPVFPEVNLFEGISYLGLNDFAKAIESFQRELKTPRPHPQSHYYLALGLRSTGRTDQALAELERAVHDNPKDPDALYQLVRTHKDIAVAELAQAAQSNPQEASKLSELARQHGDAAREAINRLKKVDPDSYQWHALMGEVYADQERFPAALTEYRAALAKRPEALGLHFSIGATLWTQAKYDEAAQEFQKALREKPNDPLTNLYLAGIAVRQRHFEEALKYLAIVQAGMPNHPLVHHLLGRCYLELKDLEKAKPELLATIEANPEDSGAHYLLARVYREMGDAQGSAREFEVFQKLMKAEKDQTLRRAEKQKEKKLAGDEP